MPSNSKSIWKLNSWKASFGAPLWGTAFRPGGVTTQLDTFGIRPGGNIWFPNNWNRGAARSIAVGGKAPNWVPLAPGQITRYLPSLGPRQRDERARAP